jgi:hypothetical protein
VHIDRQRNALGLQDVGLGVRSIWPLAVLFGIATARIMLQESITPSAWHHGAPRPRHTAANRDAGTLPKCHSRNRNRCWFG